MIYIILYYNENFSPIELYTAVIVEPREHPALELVLTNFTKNLDNRWKFVFYHGTSNIDYVMNIINNKLKNQKNRFTFINLNIKNLNISDYNKLLYNKNFYNNIPTEMFLIFQVDTLICNKFKNNIYKFMKYDYVGAPWKKTWFNRKNYIENSVGNGGLSLRRKSKMLEILNNCNIDYYLNEDVFFSKILCSCNKDIKINKPNIEEAKEFAIETIYNNNSFGIHKPWLYINHDICFCEDYNKLIELNSK